MNHKLLGVKELSIFTSYTVFESISSKSMVLWNKQNFHSKNLVYGKNCSISSILETNYQVSDSYFSYQESSSLKDSDEEPVAGGAILLMTKSHRNMGLILDCFIPIYCSEGQDDSFQYSFHRVSKFQILTFPKRRAAVG